MPYRKPFAGSLNASKQEMCKKAVEKGPRMLKYVPDHFKMGYNGYKKRKAQKVSIKEGLMPITRHPSRWWDWCVPENGKKRQKNVLTT